MIFRPNLRKKTKTVALLVVILGIVSTIVYVSSTHATASLPGDINNSGAGDGAVNITDLSILLTNYGTNNAAADINASGTVDITDLSILLTNFGRTAIVSTCPNEATGQCRPYDVISPWNTEIPGYQTPASVSVDPNSTTFKNAIKAVGLALTSNPDAYTIQTYKISTAATTANPVATPKLSVQLTGYSNIYDTGDNNRVGLGQGALITGVPIDSTKVRFSDPVSNSDYDSQFVFWDPETGDEWEFWQFRPAQHTNTAGIDGNTGESNYTLDTSIKYMATNYTRYHTKPNTVSGTTYKYYGRANGNGGGRGAGTPYFAGLVRPWEITQGHIDHALAFAFSEPCCGQHSGLALNSTTPYTNFGIPSSIQQYFRYPAAKSDGGSTAFGVNPPEGTRIQLNFDPNLTDVQLASKYGLNTAGVIIARALQRYGMYIIDNSGSSKVYVEHNLTANNGAGWGSAITASTLSGISWDDFRVVAPPTVVP